MGLGFTEGAAFDARDLARRVGGFRLGLRALLGLGRDGRRTGITDTRTSFTNNETRKKIKVAFAARFYDTTEEEFSEGVFVAEIESCEPEECTSCLCSTDPECMFGAMALGAGPDFNGDETVDGTDLELMMKAYGYTTGRFDLNNDGIVDSLDLDALLKNWGTASKKE